MFLFQWLDTRPRGEQTLMMRSSGLGWTTIYRAKTGRRVEPGPADLIVAWTGGEVEWEPLVRGWRRDATGEIIVNRQQRTER